MTKSGLTDENIARLKVMARQVAAIMTKVKDGKAMAPADHAFVDEHLTGALPTYPSMAACHGATGWPIEDMRKAKADGCKAFVHTRVELEPLIRYHFNEKTETPEIMSPRSNLDTIRAGREEIKLKREAGTILDHQVVKESIEAAVSMMFQRLDRVFGSELPPDLTSLSEMQIRKKLVGELQAAQTELRQQFQKLGKEEI